MVSQTLYSTVFAGLKSVEKGAGSVELRWKMLCQKMDLICFVGLGFFPMNIVQNIRPFL